MPRPPGEGETIMVIIEQAGGKPMIVHGFDTFVYQQPRRCDSEMPMHEESEEMCCVLYGQREAVTRYCFQCFIAMWTGC